MASPMDATYRFAFSDGQKVHCRKNGTCREDRQHLEMERASQSNLIKIRCHSEMCGIIILIGCRVFRHALPDSDWLARHHLQMLPIFAWAETNCNGQNNIIIASDSRNNSKKLDLLTDLTSGHSLRYVGGFNTGDEKGANYFVRLFWRNKHVLPNAEIWILCKLPLSRFEMKSTATNCSKLSTRSSKYPPDEHSAEGQQNCAIPNPPQGNLIYIAPERFVSSRRLLHFALSAAIV